MSRTDAAPTWDIRRFDAVTSTMDVAAGLLAGGDAAQPTVIVADHQTAGRGRADRSWRSTSGAALQLTAILRLPVGVADLGPVPLLVGVAVAEAIEAIGPELAVRLKWPNDVLVDGRKAAGTLIVSRAGDAGTILQIGIGINMIAAADPSGSAGGLDRLLPPSPARSEVEALRERLLGGVLSRLAQLPAAMGRDAGADGLARWTERATLIGEPVRVRDGDRTIIGTLLGVDRRGAMRIETGPGRVITVVAGDLTRGPEVQMEHGTGSC